MIRQFSLINEYGQEFALNDVRTGFLHEPTGLGYSLDYSYQRTGYAWVRNTMNDAQSTLGGTLVYATDNPYLAQQELLTFIRTSNKLVLKYDNGVHVRYKDVDIVGYEITEITEGKILQCPVTLMGTSLWYSTDSQQATIASDGGLRYSYRLPGRIADYTNGFIDITNDGSVPAAWGMEFTGAITNPVITLSVNGSDIAKIEITASIPSGSKIIYQSKDGDGETYCFSGTDSQIDGFKRRGITDGLVNLALGFDLANDNFFKIPTGASRLSVTAGSALTNPIAVSIFKFYRAV